MPLTILSDSDVRALLLSLTKDDILDLQQNLADALHYYSTATEEDQNGCCSSYQPLRTALKRSDGQTTLFMPASSNDGLGVKIVTLAVPDSQKSDRAFVTSSIDSQTTAIEPPGSIASSQSTTPKGSLTLLDKDGATRALVNAEEITAFRTALASTMLFKKRQNVHDMVVFGAGKQAYWHIRLALLLRGSEIHHLNIINRDFERAHRLIETLYTPSEEPVKSPQTSSQLKENASLFRPKVQILTPNHNEYERLLKSTIRTSSVIFCTTPSLTPLFPATYLTSIEGRRKGRYICAIGSYKPHMVEIHPDILRQAVAPEHKHHHHKHARQGGAVIVDSVEACLKEAGEVIQAGLHSGEVVEIGELVMLKRDAEKRREECKARREREEAKGLDVSGVELGEAKKKGKKDKMEMENVVEAHQSLLDWLQKGNVVYKSVGLGLMDVVVGGDLVRLADERRIGTKIEDF
ncbi:NAD(P)-binding protein [Corynespora cassiicola Philippines]|uniref:NAD(P)-binding protein n=1 Tax=Corynespora cassiicola Philippines TaxID=1448308 RepID=A0A2T2N6J0_CORCC|nr:NAD(P)-binding protein [Corynespora cassiicola Philippines]